MPTEHPSTLPIPAARRGNERFQRPRRAGWSERRDTSSRYGVPGPSLMQDPAASTTSPIHDLP
jgi:hypothetical protein